LIRLGSPHIHLVLNGAYDIKVLLAQARAFSVLPLEDLIISHLDEEAHWGKLWNLTLGASLPIRHLSAGQNIPGEFWEASAERILACQFPRSPNS
jgi:flagellar biosynthesis GTPase FlhF